MAKPFSKIKKKSYIDVGLKTREEELKFLIWLLEDTLEYYELCLEYERTTQYIYSCIADVKTRLQRLKLKLEMLEKREERKVLTVELPTKLNDEIEIRTTR